MNECIGERLREERERLGYSQIDFAGLAGVGRGSQANYEKGERSPDANYLAAVAEVGADIAYIVTGIKSANVRRFDRNAKTLELIEECAAALRIIERRQGLQLNDDKFGLIVRMLFEEYYDEFVGEEEPEVEAAIDSERVIQLVRLAS